MRSRGRGWVKDATLSRHRKQLLDIGLATKRRDGTNVCYRLVSGALRLWSACSTSTVAKQRDHRDIAAGMRSHPAAADR